MLDSDGFRPNVGIILLNRHNQVFWGKRIRSNSWQFPQGGIDPGETPEQAMLRELYEEIGLMPEHIRVIARTRDWLRYEVPDRYVRREARGYYRGQKQIWFLLQLLGRDSDMDLYATNHPEFESWRWNNYWVPLDVVIEFKRGVYKNALKELSSFIPRADSRNRFLRGRRRSNRFFEKADHKSSNGENLLSSDLPQKTDAEKNNHFADNMQEEITPSHLILKSE